MNRPWNAISRLGTSRLITVSPSSKEDGSPHIRHRRAAITGTTWDGAGSAVNAQRKARLLGPGGGPSRRGVDGPEQTFASWCARAFANGLQTGKTKRGADPSTPLLTCYFSRCAGWI